MVEEWEAKRFEADDYERPSTDFLCGWSPIWKVQLDDDLIGSVEEVRRCFLTKPLRYAEAAIASNADDFPLAAEQMVREGRYLLWADARDETSAMAALHGARREFWKLPAEWGLVDFSPGDVIDVESDLLSGGAGRFVVVVTREMVTGSLTRLWGPFPVI